jgi:hypothetical protein
MSEHIDELAGTNTEGTPAVVNRIAKPNLEDTVPPQTSEVGAEAAQLAPPAEAAVEDQAQARESVVLDFSQPAGQEQTVPVLAPAPREKQFFSRSAVPPTLEIKIGLPDLFPDWEPFGFEFGYALSRECEQRREKYMAMAVADRVAKRDEQALDEVCDLLRGQPVGFGDYTPIVGQTPGQSFRSYVEHTTDPDARLIVNKVVNAAEVLYWDKITPREFLG